MTAFPEVTINRSADEVWGVLSDFGDMGWFPGTSSTTLLSDDKRVHRLTFMQGGSVEELFEYDDANRTYTYGFVDIVDGLTPTSYGIEGGDPIEMKDLMGNHAATIAVSPISPSECRVVYSYKVAEGDDEHANNLQMAYQMALNHLKQTIEG